LVAQLKDEQIDSFEDLEKFDRKKTDALVKLALQTEPLDLKGKNFGFFGLTSTGKSTIINRIIGENLAEVGACETTKEIQPYNGQGYRLYDIPGRNDDLSYFNMKYIAFWKALTSRIVVITVTIKEMTTVFRLLDAINLRYDILVNKFDLVKCEEREKFQNQIKQQIIDCKLRGVNNLWFISAENPNEFSDWDRFTDYLQRS
jgi:GTP-binding protein EngB required for normal cell division